MVLCDEAAQCIEMSTLIPLRHGTIQCVMVGDHKQLSATTFSKQAAVKGFDISLFERCQTCLEDDRYQGKIIEGAVMLDTQYRMLPEISQFPSRMFYRNQLLNGENVKAPFYAPSFIDANNDVDGSSKNGSVHLKPSLFFDVVESSELLDESTKSYSNKLEALFCANLVKHIVSESRRLLCKTVSIGIITPYQQQLQEIKFCYRKSNKISPSMEENKATPALYQSNLEEGELKDDVVQFNDSEYNVEMNTVDAFQGREKNIIIFSCVRANDEGNIGFLSDKRRMNVALTRAKYGMYVIGNSNTLRNSYVWDTLIQHASCNNLLVKVSSVAANIRDLIIRDTCNLTLVTNIEVRGLSGIERNKKRPVEEVESEDNPSKKVMCPSVN